MDVSRKRSTHQTKIFSLIARHSAQQARKFSKKGLTEANRGTKIELSYSIQK